LNPHGLPITAATDPYEGTFIEFLTPCKRWFCPRDLVRLDFDVTVE
jgi:hypothetical protein